MAHILIPLPSLDSVLRAGLIRPLRRLLPAGETRRVRRGCCFEAASSDGGGGPGDEHDALLYLTEERAGLGLRRRPVAREDVAEGPRAINVQGLRLARDWERVREREEAVRRGRGGAGDGGEVAVGRVRDRVDAPRGADVFSGERGEAIWRLFTSREAKGEMAIGVRRVWVRKGKRTY